MRIMETIGIHLILIQINIVEYRLYCIITNVLRLKKNDIFYFQHLHN